MNYTLFRGFVWEEAADAIPFHGICGRVQPVSKVPFMGISGTTDTVYSPSLAPGFPPKKMTAF